MLESVTLALRGSPKSGSLDERGSVEAMAIFSEMSVDAPGC
jgi:hypothetical protein